MLRLEQEAAVSEALMQASKARLQAQQAHEARLAETAKAREALKITAAVLSEKNAAAAEITGLKLAHDRMTAAKRAAEQAKATAEVEEAAIHRRKAKLENEVSKLAEQRDIAEQRKNTMTNQLDAVEASLHFIASDVVDIDPQSEKLSWGNAAPQDSHAQNAIIATIEAAGDVVAKLIRAITKTVAAVLRKERQRIAEDAQVLLDIREEMGIGQDVNLEDVLKRNQKDEPGW